MLRLSPSLDATVRARHGVVCTDELLADGVGTNTIRRLVGRRHLVAVHAGVYRVSLVADSFEARCAAACLAAPDVVVGGPAAGRLWGFRHLPKITVPILLAPHGRSGLAGDVKLRRTNLLGTDQIVLRDDGIRLSSPPRTWFDCAVDLDDERFEALTEFVVDRHAGIPTLWAVIRHLEARGRPGLARARRVLSRRAAWQKPADSRLELSVLRALERRGVGPLVRQYRVALPNGEVVHLDGALPDLRWGVEVDHVTWHGGRLDAQYDKQRDRQLRLVGWQIERVTDQEWRGSRRATIDSLVALHRRRRAEFGPLGIS